MSSPEKKEVIKAATRMEACVIPWILAAFFSSDSSTTKPSVATSVRESPRLAMMRKTMKLSKLWP